VTEHPESYRSGVIAVAGRPNVGKSTLVNSLVGEKISIVTPKPQTTRHRAMGIYTDADAQLVFVDTPGVHRSRRDALNRALNRTAAGALPEADLVVFVIEALRWTDEDADVLGMIRRADVPVMLVVNKVDKVVPRERLLPFLDEVTGRHDFTDVIPLSALRGKDVARFRGLLKKRVPEGPALFPEHQRSDRGPEFHAAEAVREKLMFRMRQELPYGIAVEIESFADEPDGVEISAVIWVARKGQKAIVIGRGGQELKAVGTAARRDLEARFGKKVMLRLWVKVRENWADSEADLKRFGYFEA
jgi:GTP-binding protein Era